MSRTVSGDPATSLAARDAYCPSCDRFIGPHDVCPYCDADSARSPAWRWLRWISLFLAVAGLVVLHIAVRYRDPPRVRIADIGPAMNFGWVEVTGTVLRKPYVIWEQDVLTYVSFAVDDGTGRLRVTISGPVAAELNRAGHLPTDGAEVRVRGTLELGRDNSLRLRVNAPGHLDATASEVLRPPGEKQ